MPNYNIYYFVIKPLQINVATGKSGIILRSPGGSSPVVQSIFARFKTDLTNLMDKAKLHIPHLPARGQKINVIPIPAASGNPTSPDFSGLGIKMHEPIVYFTTKDLSEKSSKSEDKRPEYIMLDAIRKAKSEEYSDEWVNAMRANLKSMGDHSGLALPGPPGKSFPVIASVYSNSEQNWEATNWQELLSYNIATAAFHEIAHCKLETGSRSNDPRWKKSINGMHNVPNVSVLASNGVGREPTTTDYKLMGEHMICPINFYRLDQSISNQCFRNGSVATLTPRQK